MYRQMGMMNRILAWGVALGPALDHLGDWVVTGFARRDGKVIVPTLAVGVLFLVGIWLGFRSETVVINSEPVNRFATEETIRRLKTVDGSFESDANDELASIMLMESEISQSGWALITEMKNVRKLVLQKCQITDLSLQNLLALEKLAVLGLADNPITDAAVEDLAQMKNLRALDLQGTLVTRQGVVRLRQALPGCAVIN